MHCSFHTKWRQFRVMRQSVINRTLPLVYAWIGWQSFIVVLFFWDLIGYEGVLLLLTNNTTTTYLLLHRRYKKLTKVLCVNQSASSAKENKYAEEGRWCHSSDGADSRDKVPHYRKRVDMLTVLCVGYVDNTKRQYSSGWQVTVN